jgi:hypothetical protein
LLTRGGPRSGHGTEWKDIARELPKKNFGAKSIGSVMVHKA